jgi:hypothetical protein
VGARLNALHTSLGIAVVAAHVVGFALLAQQCQSDEFVVDIRGPNAAPTFSITGDVPSAFEDRVVESLDDAPPGPGLHRKRWSIAYRGGFARSVGAAQLVGPFQDPRARECSGRVAVSQKLLDDGSLAPTTVAGQMKLELERVLKGQSITGAGDYEKIESIDLRWARLEWHPNDRAMVKDAPNGYVRAAVKIAFGRVNVPVVIALIPTPIAPPASTPASGSTPASTPMPPPPELRFRVASRAELEFGNRVAQWISDRIGGDALATRFARDEIDDALLSTLAPPPPFDLGNGQSLTFTYCSDPPEVVEGAFGAIPFAVEIGSLARDPSVLPPKRGKATRMGIASDAQVAIDLDVDALNAVLFELWRGGFLDRELEKAGLHDKFNADPIVQELLSLRISAVRLALPPVIAPAGDHLRLSADARVTIADGTSTTIGRVWGGLDFKLGAGAAHGDARATSDKNAAHTIGAASARGSGSDAPSSGSNAVRTSDAATLDGNARAIPSRDAGTTDAIGALDVQLGALELSCERAPTRLAPCYSDLVAAIRGRGSEFHGALTGAFAAILTDIFVERRLGASGLPADLVIQRAVPRVTASGGNASLHLDLAASLVPTVH